MILIEILVLGSGGVMPTSERLTSSILVTDWNGYTILLDAGEGIQFNLARAGKSIHNIDLIAITHEHGDHINGVPGLIQSMTVSKRTRPLAIAGPSPVIDFITETLEATSTRLGFEIKHYRLDYTGSMKLYGRGGDSLILHWTPTCHTRESMAFALEWKLRPRINTLKLIEKGATPGPWIRELIEKGEVAIGDRKIRIADVSSPSRHLKIVYTGDTAPCRTIVDLSRNADILIHEATYAADMSDEAIERRHSSSIHAAIIAKQAGVKKLILTHISPRYRGYDARRIEAEARSIFPETVLAWDLMRIILGPSWRRG